MTRALSHVVLKDECRSFGSLDAENEHGMIKKHLRNHIHLTNCIHLKNHMHCHSPIQAEKSLMRDLDVLQRSKSLRDPSTSPSSWLSPFVVTTLVKGSGEDAGVHSGRSSIGVDVGREVVRFSTSHSNAAGLRLLNAPAAGTISDQSAGKRSRDYEVRKGEDGNRLNVANLLEQNPHLKTLSEQLEEIPSHTDNETRIPSHPSIHKGRRISDKRSTDLKMSEPAQCSGLSRLKRRKFRGAKRSKGLVESKNGRVHNDFCVTSTSFAPGFMQHKCCLGGEGEGQENDEMDVTRAPRNGCGIPWNWSRIHHRGKNFLDIAGRSLSCGLSDSRLKKDGDSVQHSQKDKPKVPISPIQLTSSTGSDSEALPFLLDPFGSPESNINPCTSGACSGELGLYANNNHHELDSDLVSEASSSNQPNSRGCCEGRHQSLTQKYMPKTFKDLVGQSLVMQALTNAVLRRKVGLIYVFYGPHGNGKTSCARIFAKSLNCQSTEHPKPCDACTSCISHNLGKNRNLLEVGAVSFDNGRILDALNNAVISTSTSQFKVFIVDDCDNLPPDYWMAISKVAYRAPRHVVFILVSHSLNHLPHTITSRCQKFYFPKLKELDIVIMLQRISTIEGLEIDRDALKLIASRSDGSLRDAEMTLDQLSLLGQRISLPIVQELVGLVSDEKLVDLLDVALSADTVSTIKSLREIIEAGVEPLALMSQLATLITDILAGSYIFTRERLRKKFFCRQTLTKEDMEKLRQALRTLSEAEKNVRLADDKLTWLTAALLQIVPDQQYVMPSSSMETNFNQNPMLLNSINESVEVGNVVNMEDDEFYSNGDLSRNIGLGRQRKRVMRNAMQVNNKIDKSTNRGKEHFELTRNGKDHIGHTPEIMRFNRATKDYLSYNLGRSCKIYGNIWQDVIENIQPDALKQFLSQEGWLSSVSLDSVPIVQLVFESPLSKSKAEKFKGKILKAFASVLNTTVILEINCDPQSVAKQVVRVNRDIGSENGSSRMASSQQSISKKSSGLQSENLRRWRTKEYAIEGNGCSHTKEPQYDSLSMGKDRKGKISECVWTGEGSSHQHEIIPPSRRQAFDELNHNKSLVKGKVSLAHVIQQAEGGSNHGGWTRHKAISIADKLEQENMRLEPRSRSLLCWKGPRVAQSKRLLCRVRTRNPRCLLKLVTCSKCLSSRSPR